MKAHFLLVVSCLLITYACCEDVSADYNSSSIEQTDGLVLLNQVMEKINESTITEDKPEMFLHLLKSNVSDSDEHIPEEHRHSGNDSSHEEFHFFPFLWEYLAKNMGLVLCWIVIGDHHNRFLPQFCFLIIIGVIAGFFFIGNGTLLEFGTKFFVFFYVLPIILETAYSLDDHAMENIGTIFFHAFLGTVLNIGLLAAAISLFGFELWDQF
ncbi:hypothetical protein B9Z55_023337 [Caenorhabditis nigoni]|uniref:Sodium/calcium exchanger membrane region domain-containing protein n=1 Tax=Caenorhabditis nigoni TaxID=1611254 RepID=A0A2G5SPF7_9PELO|nr:hypothetical protein B9Z55_023337 [Caenorhabditis nigoni]